MALGRAALTGAVTPPPRGCLQLTRDFACAIAGMGARPKVALLSFTGEVAFIGHFWKTRQGRAAAQPSEICGLSGPG